MSLRRSIFCFLALICFPAFSATSSTIGWVVYILLRVYQSQQVGVSESTGLPLYTASYIDSYYTQVRFWPGAVAPSYSDLGLIQYHDLSGASPENPPTGIWRYYLIQNLVSKPVKSDMNIDYWPLGDITTSHPVTPVYEGNAINSPSVSDPFSYNMENVYSGRNDNFDPSKLNILQGNVYPVGASTSEYYLYDPTTGNVIITRNPNSNMGTYQWNDSTGQFEYQAWSGDSSSGSIDLSPVVNAINSQGANVASAISTQSGLTRDQLVSLLGANGNSWVYDCKLSLSQLYDLASAYYPQFSANISQLGVDVSTEVRQGSETIVGAIENINVSPVVNVPAPVVNVSPPEVSIDTSSLAKDSTLQEVLTKLNSHFTRNDSNLKSVYSALYSYLRPMVLTIRDTLTGWGTGNNFTSPVADFGDDAPNDSLPSGIKEYHENGYYVSDAQTVLGSLVSWGQDGAPSVFDGAGISSLLTMMVGSIPSVGSDETMFDIDWDIPYLGKITRHYTWNDIPYIGEFRDFLLWCLYVFFGIAIFKLIHKTIF